MPSCSVCSEPFCSDPSFEGGRIPIQSARCSHAICLPCVRSIRGKSSLQRTETWISCPTCEVSTAFNADDPTICLTNCELVKSTVEKESTGNIDDAGPSTSGYGSSAPLKREHHADADKDLVETNPPAKRVKIEGDDRSAVSEDKNDKAAPSNPENIVIDLTTDDRVKIEEDGALSDRQHKERRKCKGCKRSMSERHFNSSQWGVEARMCKHCVKRNDRKPSTQRSDKHPAGSHRQASSGTGLDEAAKVAAKRVKIKIEEDVSIQPDAHKERRECRYCKKFMSRRHFSSSQWDKDKRTCRPCGKSREREKLRVRETAVPADDSTSGNRRTMRIMLANEAGAEAKFLCEVAPLCGSFENDDLPNELTLEGHTRQEWGTVSGDSDARDWTTVHLKCVDDKRYLRGFLDNLASRQKAAFGAFALPDGSCGVLVVPFVQPEPEGYAGKNERILFCKYALGLDPSGGEGKHPSPLHGEGVAGKLPPAEAVNPGQQIRLLAEKPTATPRQSSNGAEESEQKTGRAGEEIFADAAAGSLSGLLRAQIATNERAASAPKVQRTAMAKVGVPTRGYAGPTMQTWFGSFTLGTGNEDSNS